MTREWKPGDVAVATVSTRRGVRVIRFTGDPIYPWQVIGGDTIGGRIAATAVKQPRLVSIDELLLFVNLDAFLDANQKPEEPTGLGAVVLDTQGRAFVRHQVGALAPWLAAAPADPLRPYRYYSDLDVDRVLSKGVDIYASEEEES